MQSGSVRSPAVGEQMLYLTRQDVVDVGMTPDEVIEHTRSALVEHGRAAVEMPAKIAVHPRPDAFLHAMPAWVPALASCGAKWIGSFPGNVERGLPQTAGLIVLNDDATGLPIAIMDGTWVTMRRTSAVSALSAERLARQDAAVIGIIGCGVQGRAHAEDLLRILPGIRELRLFDRRAAAAMRLRDDLAARAAGVDVRAVETVEAAVSGADVVVSATVILPVPEPLVRDSWIGAGALVLPVDLDAVWEWETLARADKFLVDSLDEMDYFRGIGFLPNGLPPLHAETGQVVAGLQPGRQSDAELIVAMNIGMGVTDVVVAHRLYERALEQGRGSVLTL